MPEEVREEAFFDSVTYMKSNQQPKEVIDISRDHGLSSTEIVSEDENIQLGPETVIPTEGLAPKLSFAESFRKYKDSKLPWAVAGVLAVGSVATTLVTTAHKSNWEELWNQVEWAIPAGAVTETAFIIGGVMMGVSAGLRMRELLKFKGMKTRITSLLNSALNEEGLATDSKGTFLIDRKLFKAGFVINALGAVGTAAVGIAIASQLPIEAAGIAVWCGLDLIFTVGLRIAISKALKDKKNKALARGQKAIILDPKRVSTSQPITSSRPFMNTERT